MFKMYYIFFLIFFKYTAEIIDIFSLEESFFILSGANFL